MNGLRDATSSGIVVVVVIVVVGSMVHGSGAETSNQRTGRQLVNGGRDLLSNWLPAAVNGCKTAGWPKCIAQKMARTIHLLEKADDLPITNGVRLIKNAAKTTDRSKKNHTYNIIDRIVSFVDSHSLQIDLWTLDNGDNVTVEGRRRHAYRRVFPIVVGTYMIMSAVLLPLGFMFMSTLGGKALLVSKMALMISLMSNIKKIFSYEYYVPPAPVPAGQHHWKRTLLAHRTTAGPLYSSYTA